MDLRGENCIHFSGDLKDFLGENIGDFLGENAVDLHIFFLKCDLDGVYVSLEKSVLGEVSLVR
jgi:hypothetical protein